MQKSDWIVVAGGLTIIGLMFFFRFCITKAEDERTRLDREEEESRELEHRRFEL